MNGRTNSSGTTINDLEIPLDPCTNLIAKAGNGQVSLTWTDPKNKYATPEGEAMEDTDQLVSVWAYTRIVRKIGSAPASPNDGVLVVESSVRNQYQNTAYMDSGLTNDTTYYYGVFAINENGVESEGAFENATPIVGTAVSTLAVGTLVKIKENGNPVEYMVVHQGLPSSRYDESCNGCWLLRKDIYTMRVWDNSGNSYGYGTHNIHDYLNGTFLNLFDNDIKNAIKQVKIPYQDGDGYNGSVAFGANGLSCKIFLLSGDEVDLIESNLPRGEGTTLSYFEYDGSSLTATKRIANYNGSKAYWWLRSPNTDNTDDVWYIDRNGYPDSRNYETTYGVRPALVLDSSAFVDTDLNVIPA